MQAITISEASEKICPFMSKAIVNGNGSTTFADVKCIAEKCISWNFSSPVSETGRCLLLSK